MVSVIIPVYNGAERLRGAVASVLAQVGPLFELLIVDDGSTDESMEIANQFASAHPTIIRVLQHTDGNNHGVAAARNLAAGHARGKYLAFLDADDRWLPTKLERQMSYMETHSHVGLTFTRALITREDRGEHFMPGIDELGHEPPTDHKQALIDIIALTVNYIFSSVMVRAEVFRAVGGFCEDLPFQSEDRIMVARVSANHQVSLVPEVLCEYLAHGTSYSARVVESGIAPIIFYDMQSRVAIWLAREDGKPDWGRDIAGSLLPAYFFPALLCKLRPKLMARVMADTFAVCRIFPDLTPYLFWRALLHTRLGRLLRM